MLNQLEWMEAAEAGYNLGKSTRESILGNSGGRLLRIVGWAVVIIVVLIAVGITATVGWRPVIGPKVRPVTEKKFEATPASLARGRYLAENVMGCIECHTPDKEDVIPPVRTGL